MVRRPVPAAAVAIGVVMVLVLAGPTGRASTCPDGSRGTLGGPAQTHEMAAGPITVYVDDRGAVPDENDAEDENGLWVYLESNDVAGLQRGGTQVVFDVLADHGGDPWVPHVDPIRVFCDPALGRCVTLFPSGVGGAPLSELMGLRDGCTESGDPDTLLY